MVESSIKKKEVNTVAEPFVIILNLLFEIYLSIEMFFSELKHNLDS